MTPKILMLDLGNVLIDLQIDVFQKEAEDRLGRKIDLGNDPLHHDHMAGKFDGEELRKRIFGQYGLKIEKSEFQDFWSLMLGPDRTALLPLLDQLRRKMKLALCSNTDAIHIDYLKKQGSRMITGFDFYCYSYEMGQIKPDMEYFLEALRIIDHPPENCIFLDDNLPNIETAINLGINAIHTPTEATVIKALKDLL